MKSPQKVTVKRRIIQAAEAVGFHRVLGLWGTRAARKITRSDVELLFDEIWVRRVGNIYFGDRARFDYYIDEFKFWNDQHRIWINDPKDFWFYAYSPKEGDIIVDIGAGFGNDTLQFSRSVGASGRVISVEAHPAAFKKLEKTCKWSKLENVSPICVAVGSKDGSVRISGDDDHVSNTIADDVASVTPGAIVPLKRFDAITEEHGLDRIALLKMNIEGAETEALKGMPKTLANSSAVVISCHDFRTESGESEYFRTKKQVADILTAAGFLLRERLDDPRPYIRDTLYGARAGSL